MGLVGLASDNIQSPLPEGKPMNTPFPLFYRSAQEISRKLSHVRGLNNVRDYEASNLKASLRWRANPVFTMLPNVLLKTSPGGGWEKQAFKSNHFTRAFSGVTDWPYLWR